jgi:hypothetical protein
MLKLAAAVATLVTSISYCSCADRRTPDPPSVVASESRDLIRRVRAMYEERKGQPDWMPRPLRVVAITGNAATLSLAGPINRNSLDLRYAAEWQHVYADHHGGEIICVDLHAVWSSGDEHQHYPVNPNTL